MKLRIGGTVLLLLGLAVFTAGAYISFNWITTGNAEAGPLLYAPLALPVFDFTLIILGILMRQPGK